MSQFLLTLFVLCFAQLTLQRTKEEWKTRTIYHLLTDRFAKDDNSDLECNLMDRTYCGGTYKGIINNLDYITSTNILSFS